MVASPCDPDPDDDNVIDVSLIIDNIFCIGVVLPDGGLGRESASLLGV